MEKILVLGLGQCGSTIANTWSKKSKSHIFGVINTSVNDEKKADKVENKYLISGGKVLGMAKERKNVLNVIREDQQNLLGFLTGLIKENEIKHTILISSSGGGTGSGLITEIARLLDKKLKIRAILVTPELTRDMKEFENTIDVTRDLQKYDVAVRVVSNDRVTVSASRSDKLNDVNNYIAETEEQLIQAGHTEALDEILDLAEIETLMFTKGYSAIYRIIADKDELNNKMIEKMSSSPDLPMASDKAVEYIGYVFYSNKSTRDRFDESKFERTLGITASEARYSAVLPHEKESQILMVTAGCTLPDSISKYLEQYELLKADVKIKNKVEFKVDKIEKNNDWVFEEDTKANEIPEPQKKETGFNWMDGLSF